ncbi:MAG: serine/threonine protein kinase, partial [Myxococcota bacterium]
MCAMTGLVPTEQPLLFGRYRLEKKLASGGMGEVFLARMQGPAGFEKKVVIKRILPHLAENEQFVERFLDEGRLVVQLSHSNIVQIVDMGVHQQHYYLAMEWVDGLDVRDLLKKLAENRVRMPPSLVVFVIGELARGLSYAHSRADDDGVNLGIIHRDVSPSNLMISREGEVKLLDFGIAKAASHMAHSVSGSLHGKFLYMSPEQAAARALDQRSDLFSLGICAYEMLTGHRPFQGANEIGTLELIRAGEYIPIADRCPDCPEGIGTIIDRCLRIEAEHRFATASDLNQAALAWLVESKSVVSATDLAAFVKPWIKPRTPTQQVSLDEALSRQIDALLGEGTPVARGTRMSAGSGITGRTPAGGHSASSLALVAALAEASGDSVLGMSGDSGRTTGRVGRDSVQDVPRASRNR